MVQTHARCFGCTIFSGYHHFSGFRGSHAFFIWSHLSRISQFFRISGYLQIFRMCFFLSRYHIFLEFLGAREISGCALFSGYHNFPNFRVPTIFLDVPFFPVIMVLSGYHDFSELPPCENLGYPPWPPVGGYPPLATSWGLPPWPPVGRCCNPCWGFYLVLINCYMMLMVFVKSFGLVFAWLR